MAHIIRDYMAKTDGEWPLDGDIEADETYIGGKRSGGKRGRGAPGKAVVFGMLERGGDVMTKIVPIRKKTLQPIMANVESGSTVHTDELTSVDWTRLGTHETQSNMRRPVNTPGRASRSAGRTSPGHLSST